MRTLFLILFLILSLHAEDEYELGEGIKLGSLPFYIGGYFSFDYKQLDDTQRYRLDDIAILGYGGHEKFSYLVELEFKEFYSITTDNKKTTTNNHDKLHIERMYVDYNLDENYIFRIGKYNSPIGFWNLLPINVLRETTSSPVSSNIIFPKFTTGASASYSSYETGEFKLDFILQNNKDLDADYNNYVIDKHYGIGTSYERDNYTLKLNAGYFHKLDTQLSHGELYYILLSAKYETDKYQIMTELGAQQSKDEFTTSKAAYLQGLYRFTPKHLGVLRLEALEDNVNFLEDEFAVFGYTYRPLYPIAIKSEFQVHSKSKLNQVLLSFSVLF